MEANAAKESLIRLPLADTSHLFLSLPQGHHQDDAVRSATFADVNLDIYSQVMAVIDSQALFGKEKGFFYLLWGLDSKPSPKGRG